MDISLGGSPRKAQGHAAKNSSHVDRRSMPSMGYMTHTVSAPSLHGKSADDTYLQLKKDLEYLDLKMTGRDLLKDRSLKPMKIAESDIDVKLSIFCEQDRILQDLEDKIRALKENKVRVCLADSWAGWRRRFSTGLSVHIGWALALVSHGRCEFIQHDLLGLPGGLGFWF